jgi:hypothetical protein
MKTHEQIIHQFQLAHSLHCNDQARYQIAKLCKAAENKEALKWNEFWIWIRNNETATHDDMQVVRRMIERGESVRGFKFGEEE